MFEEGKEYQNRTERYVVLSIQGNALRVQLQDGSERTLDATTQERIIRNIARENDLTSAGGTSPAVEVPRNYSAARSRVGVRTKRAQASDTTSWSRYDLWNKAIFEFFFNQQMSKQLVYIDVDESVIESLAPDSIAKSSPEQDFVQAVKNTLGILGRNYFSPHFSRTDAWRAEGERTPPPFLGLLASFCLAAQKMQSDEGISSSNYYVRLAQLFLGPSFRPDQKISLQNGFSRVRLLWDELDTWLWKHNGDLGLPSAQPMSGLTHVGYPISQSLFRAQDRTKLVEFFWSSGLYPGQQVSPLDLERLLDYWIPESNLSSAAKARWSNRFARRKMAEIASLELGIWKGTLPDRETLSDNMVTAPMALQVMVVGGPRPRLEWDVVLRVPSDLMDITYDSVTEERSLPFTDEPGRSVTVTHGLSTRWSDPIPNVSIGNFLLSQVELVEREGRNRVRWQPQKVLALGWDDELKVFRSQPHLEFGKRGMVIAFESVASTVENLLAGVDLGYMKRVPDNLGVPKGWTVFDNVQLSRVPDTGGDPDLSPLVPEISSTVEWVGGIAFPGRRHWLASRLPLISANSIDEVEEISAAVHIKSLFNSEETAPVRVTSKVAGNALDLELAGRDLPDGVYSLIVTGHRSSTGDREFSLARQTFDIKSPDSRFSKTTSPLGYRSNRSLWPLSAATIGEDHQPSLQVAIRGAVIDREQHLAAPEGTPPLALDSVSKHLDEDLVVSTERLNQTILGVTNCFTGAHHWLYDTVKDLADYYKPHKGVCVNCGKRDVVGPQSFQVFLHRESTRPALTNLVAGQTVSSPSLNPDSNESAQIDFDGLLDACFTWGSGTWSHFQLLARQVSGDPWFPHEAIHLFSSLGYLDVEWDVASTLPLQWSVSPSAIVMTGHGDAFLAGHRTPRMLKALQPLIESQGGHWIAETNIEGPTTYRVSGVPTEVLRGVVDRTTNDRGIGWQFSDQPDRAIASSLPTLWDVVGAGPQVDIPSTTEYFEVDSARWSVELIAGRDGLYRTNSLPRRYFLNIGGVCRLVSYRSGKHLAGAYHHKVLLAYEPQTNRLKCPLGAQLPGLYERAVVLSSGSSPEVDLRDRTVTYHRVPENVAQLVWRKITELRSDRG